MKTSSAFLTRNYRSMCNPNWWTEGDPISPRKQPCSSSRRPIFLWRYGNLRHPERYPPFPALAKPSPATSSQQLSPSLNWGVAHRDDGSERWACRRRRDIPGSRIRSPLLPLVPTTYTGTAGGVKEAESPLRDLHETDSQVSVANSPLWCPFEFAGELGSLCCRCGKRLH